MKGRGGEGGFVSGVSGGFAILLQNKEEERRTKDERKGAQRREKKREEERRRREEEEKKKRRREKKKKKNKNDSLDCVPSPQRRDINLYVFRRCGRDHAGAFCLNGSGQIAHSTSS